MIIVCGTDLSEQSRAAVRVAAALTRRLHASELWLVHVLEPATSTLEPAARQAVTANADGRLRQYASDIAKYVGTAEVHHSVLAGPAREALARFAGARQGALLIVASQGHGASPIYRVGGTSERLAESSEIPLLVVRDAAPFEAWAEGKRPLRLLLAVDWTRGSDAPIRWVKTFREAGPCDVVVGHCYYSDLTDDGSPRYGLRRVSMVDADPRVEQLLTRDLERRVGDLGGTGKIVFRPKHALGRLGDHLLELGEAEGVDLIVVGTHHKQRLRRIASVAAVTLHHGHSSVAVVPMPHDEVLAPDEVPRIRRVVVPTDLSPNSTPAVAFAYALLNGSEAEVHLLHVLPEQEGADTDSEVALRLRSVVPKRGVSATVVTRTNVVHHRDAAQAICETAEMLGADVICMGSHGRSGIPRAVLGSVAETVLRTSRRPVMVVRPLPP